MPTGNTLNTKLHNGLIAQNLVTGFLLKKPNFMKIVFFLSFNIELYMCLSDLSGPGGVIERTFRQLQRRFQRKVFFGMAQKSQNYLISS